MLTSMSGLLVGKVFSNRLRTKSPNNQMIEGCQTMEGPFRISTSPIDTFQVNVVQV